MTEAPASDVWNPPRLVAGTGDIYQTSIATSHKREENALNGTIGNSLGYRKVVSETNKTGSNVFRSVEWTADGTSLITVTEDNCIRTFIAPTDLLTSPTPHVLLPYSITQTPTTPFCVSPYPFFTLSDPSTAQILTSLHSQPIHLRSLLHPHISASYPLIHPTTEKYLTPHCLLWTGSGTHFLAGTDSQIHLFDVSRYNSGPLETFSTGKKRKPSKSKSNTASSFSFFSSSTIQSSSSTAARDANVRSIISTLTLDRANNVLSAGTYSRRILIYSSPYQDGSLTNVINLNAAKKISRKFPGGTKGNGITSVAFTENGDHLVVAERKSNVVFVYDMRYPVEPWAVCVGRKADTNQKLGVGYCSGYGAGDARLSNIVVAGGMDGVVRVWTPFGSLAEEEEGGYLLPKEKFVAARDPVTAVAVHPWGEVVATSSGQRKDIKIKDAAESDTESESESESESETEEIEVEMKKTSLASDVESELNADNDCSAEADVYAQKLTDDGVWDNGVGVWAL